MSAPGTWLRALFRRWCSRRTMEHLVDPIVSDIQFELARASSSPLARTRVVVRAYASFWMALLVHAATSSWSWSAAERRDLKAGALALCGSTALTAALVLALLVAIPAVSVPSQFWTPNGPRMLLALVPQALAVALPVAVLWASLRFATRVGLARGVRRTLVVGGLAGTALTIATIAIVPDANQAFRAMAFSDRGRPPQPGLPEMGWRDLRLVVASHPEWVRPKINFEGRVALCLAPTLFGLCAPWLSASTRRRACWQATASVVAYVAGFAVVDWDTLYRMAAVMPPRLLVWTPPIFALACASLFRRSSLGADTAGK